MVIRVALALLHADQAPDPLAGLASKYGIIRADTVEQPQQTCARQVFGVNLWGPRGRIAIIPYNYSERGRHIAIAHVRYSSTSYS